MTDNSNDLYHYGVPGMKWGVRKAAKLAKKRAAASARMDALKSQQKKLKAKYKAAQAKARKRYFTEFGKSSVERGMRKGRRADIKLQKNRKMQKALKQRISQLDKELVSMGKSYVSD